MSQTMATLDEITEQLNKLVHAKTGDSGARATQLAALPGHAGFGYSFMLERSQRDAVPTGKLVLRVAPEGVRIAGPADVVRQAKIMASLADTDVPVPPILWYGDEAEFFGRPYFVDGFVEGFKIADNPKLPAAELKALAHAGLQTLAALHRVDWTSRRSAWGEPQPLSDEMKRLDHLLDRPTLDPKTVARAPELREKLLASFPEGSRIGCVHGDFQWSNVLFHQGCVSAVIDWEIALLGPTLLDVGWICFFADADSWVTRQRILNSPLVPDEIVAMYSESANFPVSMDEVNWFRAFAGYRFGVITCFNLMLHRRGKRPDPNWEETALSAPRMFEHGLELLG
jgi:aminoglycoside phosphotransferase (APT) family kinase protein